jgi:hypothetical protein
MFNGELVNFFMATADIQERKLELIQWLSVIEDVSVLDKIAELKDQSTADWWDEISSAEKESISKGLEDADAGLLKPHSEAKVIYGKRL